MQTQQTPQNNLTCGFIAVMGAPNVGKSTLVNAILGKKVTIVSDKPQTTRAIMMGIKIINDCQIIFVDTPGIFVPKRQLERAIVKEAWREFHEVDYIVLVVDITRGICQGTANVMDALKKNPRPACVVINKIDLVKPAELLPLSQALYDSQLFEQVFMISAQQQDGVKDVANFLATKMPQGPWHYSESDLSSAPQQFLATEITREKVFIETEKELPYSTCVETEQWEERADGSVMIRHIIYVLREAQKKIVIGKHGQKIKRISETARVELEEIMGRKVHLFLHVKVRENWVDSPEHYEMMQLNFPK